VAAHSADRLQKDQQAPTLAEWMADSRSKNFAFHG
jgi:hypothetical protein